MLEGENVEAAFKLVRDLIVFTEKRLILVDKQGITGKKTEFQSIPYKSISRFSVETAGRFDLDSEPENLDLRRRTSCRLKAV